MGGVVAKIKSPRKVWVPETKLEAKMVEALQKRSSKGCKIKSFSSIVLKFPKIDKSLRKCKAIFEQFDEDSNGRIDQEELKHCFEKLEVSMVEEDIRDLFSACDINDDKGMEFHEFIVLLCLVYLLKKEPGNPDSQLQTEMPDLENTFETLVNAFVFLDKNNDGFVSKNEMVSAINETTSGEGSSGPIAMKRFEEMDWDKNGSVNFKEFLFAFTRWVGIDETEDEES
ncbi:hypothetical protein SAY87_005039 [Trapa incisa]|uniref:EF-hand domain-containing protein n=1 Tax=Trapa incisa TaxID=236973 RepID=A0AAN7JQ41_9MYRT|nr:hypothetical protein SAY87_005039 [Trapa incisa]